MSEFKFSCPACGQNILCDTAHAGTEIACPGCNASVIVPEETAESVVSAQADTPPVWPGYTATPTQRTSGLAIVSLVCSLSSFITCVGWLPGIICGHVAKSRIRRNSLLKGSGLATAGLIIGYLVLMLEAGTAAVHIWRFSAAVKQGYKNVRQDLATNSIVITQTQSATVSNDNQRTEPVKPAAIVTNNEQQNEPTKSEWTSDISKASFPNHPAVGKLHGIDFTVRTVSFRNTDLKISSTNGTSLDIHGLGASIEGQSYEIQSNDDGGTNPRVKMTWHEGDVIQTATFSKGYGMKLQFDQASNRRVSAKIYLCFPDDSKSCVAGTFEVKLAKPK
jgi:DNA-directed RNA polymerase subunit RPC12/RpoP